MGLDRPSCLDSLHPRHAHASLRELRGLYIGLLFPSLCSKRCLFIYFVAVCASCMVMRGAFMPPPADGESLWLRVANHLLVVAAVWGAALLCQLRERAVAAASRLACEREVTDNRTEELVRTADVLQAKNEQLAATRDVAVYTLAKVAESRDLGTGRHLEQIRLFHHSRQRVAKRTKILRRHRPGVSHQPAAIQPAARYWQGLDQRQHSVQARPIDAR